MTKKKKENINFMSNPEIIDIVGNSLEEMRLESDRGAVMIAAEILSTALENLFETIIPNDYGKKRRKEMLSYPAPLGTLSGKADIAYAVQIISKEVYHSITLLRRLRNKAAHSDVGFKLSEHKDRLKELLEFGSGGHYFATTTAYKIITEGLYKSLEEYTELEKTLGKKPFSDWNEFLAYMKDEKQFISMVENQTPRVSLNVGVTILCGLILHQRDTYLKNIRSE